MKIGFISSKNPADIKAWSGTIHYLYKTLSRDYAVKWIDVSEGVLPKLYLKLAYALNNRILKRGIAPENTLVYSYLMGNVLNRYLKKSKESFDLFFAPAACQLISHLDTNTPIIYLSDATFASMIDYYREYSNLPEWNIRQGNLLEKRAFDKAHRVIFSSDWAKESAISDYSADVSKMTVIPFGANVENIPRQFRGENGKRDEDCINLLFVGVDYDRKGGRLAVKTALEISRRGYKCRIFIVGCTPRDELCRSEQVEVIGFLNKHTPVDYKRLMEIQAASDFFILPTSSECAGIVFCEASCYGLPIITFDTGGVANYVENGVNGYRLPLESDEKLFADRILEMYKTDNYERLRKGAQQKYEKELNWAKWLEKFNGLVKDIDRKSNVNSPTQFGYRVETTT